MLVWDVGRVVWYTGTKFSEDFVGGTHHMPLRRRACEVELEQRFPNFLTRGALFRINFYGGAP